MSKLWLIRNYVSHALNAKRGGHGIHSPFVYALVENVFNNNNSFYAFAQLNKVREQLLENETELLINDLGAGSKTLHTSNRKVKEIAQQGISSKKQCELLFKIISYLKSKIVIELGTSIGLTSLYLSNANSQGQVYTIEGSESLVNFAKKLIEHEQCNNITVMPGNFDQTFPKLLSELHSYDLLYIDGNHTYEATIRYFKLALEKHTADSVMIFDDIYWSPEMSKAWKEIKNNEAVTLSIDCFYFGMIFFRKENKQKEHFKLFI